MMEKVGVCDQPSPHQVSAWRWWFCVFLLSLASLSSIFTRTICRTPAGSACPLVVVVGGVVRNSPPPTAD